MVKRGIRGGICHAIRRYVKQIIDILKITISTMYHCIFYIGMKKNYTDRQCLKNYL